MTVTEAGFKWGWRSRIQVWEGRVDGRETTRDDGWDVGVSVAEEGDEW